MLSVVLIFLYIGITTLGLGLGFSYVTRKVLQYTLSPFSLCFAGLAIATVYAQYFSLFSGVGLIANLLLCILAVLGFYYNKEQGKQIWKAFREENSILSYTGELLLVLVVAYGASRGYQHMDTGLYHAQAIHWIETCGVVPGLVNLHTRLAYNSAVFPLNALYSFHFLGGQSFHAVAGFLVYLSARKGFQVFGVFRSKKISALDFVKIALLFYLSMIYTEMVSPSSDYFAMLFLFFVLIRWLELEEAGEKRYIPYSLLCVFLVVAVSVKLSTGIFLLLLIKPAYLLCKEKQWKHIGLFIGMGFLAILPYFLRNIILSGYLVYPLDKIDWFSFDWKLPIGDLQYDAEEIKAYAKGFRQVALKNTPIFQWFPAWFLALKSLEKLWVIGSVGSVFVGMGASVFAFLWEKKKDLQNRYLTAFILPEFTCIMGYLTWQLGTPLVRYGYIYILAFPFLTAGFCLEIWKATNWNLKLQNKVPAVFAVLLSMFLVYKGWNLAEDILRQAKQPYYLLQQDYSGGEMESFFVGETEFFVPLEYGQAGYYAFPSVPYSTYPFEMRGNTLQEGFRYKAQ